MSKPTQKKDSKDSKKHTPPPISIGDEKAKQSKTKEETQQDRTHNPTDNPQIIVRLWRLIKHEDNQPKIANIISFLMLAATIGLVWYTIGLFKKTSIQADNAIKSANAAVDAISLTKFQIKQSQKQYDDAVERQTYSDKIASQHTQKKDSLDSVTFETHKKEFDISNRAYIQFSDFRRTEIGNDEIGIEYNATDIGNSPAKLTFEYREIFVSVNDYKRIEDVRHKHREVAKTEANNIYVTKDAPQKKTIRIDGLTNEKKREIRNGIYNEYVYEEVTYVDLVSNKTRKYIFAVEIDKKNPTLYKMIYNENF